jgi:hypothetical protein
MILEGALDVEWVNDAMLAIHEVERRFRWLKPPRLRGQVTVADVLAAQGVDEHLRCVERRARSCRGAWSEHHETIRGWLPTTVRPRRGKRRG